MIITQLNLIIDFDTSLSLRCGPYKLSILSHVYLMGYYHNVSPNTKSLEFWSQSELVSSQWVNRHLQDSSVRLVKSDFIIINLTAHLNIVNPNIYGREKGTIDTIKMHVNISILKQL
ncbi:MAG: hypothetical protein P0116_06610 [Candidatus Nitrosocosmicus sp.]|nr:hypothetical protein [Candidatus Nitrosocosmicus sp.]